MKNIYVSLVLSLLSSLSAFATHLQGGEIRARQLSGQTYEISVLLYFDTVNGQGATGQQSEVNVCTGDGQTITVSRVSLVPASPGTSLGTYIANHTYGSQGIYQISTQVDNRNNNILNFQNSQNTALFLWTVLHTTLSNSTPILPSLTFNAGVKQPFVVDLKATDAEGDSVSFVLQKLSKPSPGTCAVRSVDNSFIYPNEVSASGTFKIDQVKKQLVWTAPTQVGQYIFAMVMYEWRNGVRISETYREGIINVTDRPGETVEIPPYENAENTGPITSIPSSNSPEVSISVDAFPVPTNDYVTVKAYSKKPAIITLQIIDLQGRVRQEHKASVADMNMEHQFDLRNYASGVYMIRASNDNESVSKKILR
ncbi:T9SS type A sorting domain-containing protein [Dyadobacter sp. CY312]|uniref:T9SS type A sorting domain-containing protein n=1 Tax=Dyadobacter sp. CY312 TaxID=2907303 RepID=UPI001F45187C|nr:T9SS type A sorting domain-containing protein [Dyadobacter sp. CY312]MCE7039501.1 T9SS type A sorting domain-containing protein [Dyadobacter sp. CY312]